MELRDGGWGLVAAWLRDHAARSSEGRALLRGLAAQALLRAGRWAEFTAEWDRACALPVEPDYAPALASLRPHLDCARKQAQALQQAMDDAEWQAYRGARPGDALSLLHWGVPVLVGAALPAR